MARPVSRSGFPNACQREIGVGHAKDDRCRDRKSGQQSYRTIADHEVRLARSAKFHCLSSARSASWIDANAFAQPFGRAGRISDVSAFLIGTSTAAPHPGHLTAIPACSAFARSLQRPQLGQIVAIRMRRSDEIVRFCGVSCFVVRAGFLPFAGQEQDTRERHRDDRHDQARCHQPGMRMLPLGQPRPEQEAPRTWLPAPFPSAH